MLSRSRLRQIERLIGTMPPVDQAAWELMASLDADLLLKCLQTYFDYNDTFSLPALMLQFRLSRKALGFEDKLH